MGSSVKGAVEIANTADLIGRSLTRATVQFDEEISREAFEGVSNVDVLRVNDNNRAYTLQIRGEMNGLMNILFWI
ncbi:MAG: hypothetical protein SVP52_03465 [Chloroflexota bacterium]|nr:hypothetical protein [Chloroflexota bacterium]